ncbi:transmembrane 9 superfamily member 4, partial [Caerostris extrusa]
MTSTLTQLPYEYYSLPFCRPKKGAIVYKSENLGEVLRGDRIVNTPYEVQMAVDQPCRVLCNHPKTPLNWSDAESKDVANRIQHQYSVHLLIDNLPCATRYDSTDIQPQYEHGYRLGFVEKGIPYINNHLKIILKYHLQPGENYRVVGFEVETRSIDHSSLEFSGNTCSYPESHKKQAVNVQ